jgi:hypothetical protein
MPEERTVPADLLQQAFIFLCLTRAVSVRKFPYEPLLVLRAPFPNA